MTEQITNKDYITINRDGVFVDGKPATKYHGKEIAKLEQIKQDVLTRKQELKEMVESNKSNN